MNRKTRKFEKMLEEIINDFEYVPQYYANSRDDITIEKTIENGMLDSLTFSLPGTEISIVIDIKNRKIRYYGFCGCA